MRGLELSPELTLPLDVAGEAIAILAKRGAGKTNTATVIVEELVSASVQTVIVDPVGAWWGLRYGADRKSDGLPIPIVGGQHGDVPLEQTAGSLLADVAADSRQSLLLDLSDFPSKASTHRFVTDFAERLYFRKGRQPSLLQLVLEEADSFAPQSGKGTERMRGAIEQLVRRGRSRGIGVTMVTQRSAVLNKDVLSQADVLIAMRTTSPHDIRAIRDWIQVRGDDEHGREVVESLPGLETGEAWVWNPERDLLRRTRVRRRHTFDSSATPKAGQERAQPGPVAPIDLTALGEQIQATAERAKADDPRELRKRIAHLEKVAGEATAAAIADDPKVAELERELERRNLIIEELDAKLADALGLETHRTLLCELLDGLHDLHEQTTARMAAARAERPQAEQRGHRRAATSSVTPPAAPPPRRPPADTALASRSAPPAAAGNVSGPQQRILDALAWFASVRITAPRRSPLAAVAGVSPKSSGFEKNVSTLRTLGLIDYPDGGRVCLTAAGEQAANHPTSTPTNDELWQSIYRMVSGPQATLLAVLIEHYPAALEREQLAELAGVSAASSGFEKNISTLRSFELVDYPSRGEVAALPILFIEEAR